MILAKEKELINKILALFIVNQLSYQESYRVLDEVRKEIEELEAGGGK